MAPLTVSSEGASSARARPKSIRMARPVVASMKMLERLEVAVQDAGGVGGIERRRDLAGEVDEGVAI